MSFLRDLRLKEISDVIERHGELFAGKSLLEIGSADGTQLMALRRICSNAVGIEVVIPSHTFAPVIQYDGRYIPFPDASFDVIFSSNVMEHVQDQPKLHREMQRVLRTDGKCLHVVPTATWRFWASTFRYTDLAKKLAAKIVPSVVPPIADTDVPNGVPSLCTYLSRILLQHRHGEVGNWFTEHFLFRRASWHRRFERLGWYVESFESLGLWYSSYNICGRSITWSVRQKMASALGSSCFLFVLRKAM